MKTQTVAHAEQPLVLVLLPSLEVHGHLVAALSTTCVVRQATERTLQTLTMDPRTSGVVVLDDEHGTEGLLALFAKVRERWPHLRGVALLSTRDPKDLAALDPLLGALLFKPIDGARLVALVQHHVRMAAMSTGVRRLTETTSGNPPPGAGPRR